MPKKGGPPFSVMEYIKMNKVDPLYNKVRTAEYLAVSKKTIDNWVRVNKFPKPDLILGDRPMWKLSTINLYIIEKQEEQRQRLCG